jgi:Domain of unknown function (DUF3846)
VANDKVRVLVIPVNGVPEEREIQGKLKEMQGLVGGYVEAVHVDLGVLMVNEDGTVPGRILPLNPGASVLAGRPIVGDAFLTALPTPGGSMRALGGEAIAAALGRIGTGGADAG